MKPNDINMHVINTNGPHVLRHDKRFVLHREGFRTFGYKHIKIAGNDSDFINKHLQK